MRAVFGFVKIFGFFMRHHSRSGTGLVVRSQRPLYKIYTPVE